jgi:hypothetical protein
MKTPAPTRRRPAKREGQVEQPLKGAAQLRWYGRFGMHIFTLGTGARGQPARYALKAADRKRNAAIQMGRPRSW